MESCGSLRRIVDRTSGRSQGPITRLMSPTDLGRRLKPFVFLDYFFLPDAAVAPREQLHPHSGIATVTVITEGDVRFDDQSGHAGTIAYGGVEWMRAGKGVWHGQEIAPGLSKKVAGFQLWLALSPELELSEPDNQYLDASETPVLGPASLILGSYRDVQSNVRAPTGINYLLVTLRPGKRWRYETPAGHQVGWLAVSRGRVGLDADIAAGEMAVLDDSDASIELQAKGEEPAVLVLGTAAPHPHDLCTGRYSVHTSREALRRGEYNINNLEGRARGIEIRPLLTSTVPVIK